MVEETKNPLNVGLGKRIAARNSGRCATIRQNRCMCEISKPGASIHTSIRKKLWVDYTGNEQKGNWPS